MAASRWKPSLTAALQYQGRPQADGEELDDYDDDTDTGKDDARGKLARDAEPFAHMVSGAGGHEPTPDRIPIQTRRPATTDDELDATGQMK